MKVVHCGGKGYSPEAFEALYQGLEDKISELMIEFPSTDSLPGHYIRENKKYSKQILKAVENELDKYDVIYAQGFTGWQFLKRKQDDPKVPPVLLNFHGYEMFQKAPNFRVKAEYLLFKKAVKWNVASADYVYSFGGKIDEILVNMDVPANRILSQSNGIERDWLVNRPQHNEVRTFVFVGRNERRKGIEELNEALKRLITDERMDFRFNFIGPIGEEAQINDPRIKYYGEIRDQEEIKSILRSSDCLVCPSHSEGMPTVILEGMASGLAIIATAVGAVERQVRSNGILIENLNVDVLEQAIRRMINFRDQDLMKLKERSIELIKERFLWDVIADKKVEDFQQILSSKKKIS